MLLHDFETRRCWTILHNYNTTGSALGLSAVCTPQDMVKIMINKFALLWGEAQLCLPYVC